METVLRRFPTFTFIVGPEKNEIAVYSAAFAGLSQPLNRLINGSMLEATTRICDWSDVDLDTFRRLSEYTYEGDYTLPPHCPGTMNSAVVPGPEIDEANARDTGLFTPDFIAYCRLYTIADKYCVEPLCKLAVSDLREKLQVFKLYEHNFSAIVELVHFVYANTPPSYANYHDSLRILVVSYITSIVGVIGDSDTFKDLVWEGGDFMLDLLEATHTFGAT